MHRFRYRYLSLAAALLSGFAIAGAAQAAQPLNRGLSDFRIGQSAIPALSSHQGRAPILKRGVADFGFSSGQVAAPVQQAVRAPALRPGLRDFGLPYRYGLATTSSAQSVGSPVEIGQQGGFDWGDAGIGAALAAGIVVLLGAVVAVAAHRRIRLKGA